MLFPGRKYKSGSKWSVWRWTDVGHLFRLHVVQTPYGSIMLHWLLKPDPNDVMHNHPVSFLSIVIRGSYVEENANGRTYVQWWNFIGANHKHRITNVAKNTLTLCLAGSSVRTWGFFTDTGWVPWREYNKC